MEVKFIYKGGLMKLHTHPDLEMNSCLTRNHVIIDKDVYDALVDILMQRDNESKSKKERYA